jgi:hypothetical protein
MSDFKKGTILAMSMAVVGVIAFFASFYAINLGIIASAGFIGGITASAALFFSALAFGIGAENGTPIMRTCNILVLCGVGIVTITLTFAMIVASSEVSAFVNYFMTLSLGPAFVALYAVSTAYIIGAAFVSIRQRRFIA